MHSDVYESTEQSSRNDTAVPAFHENAHEDNTLVPKSILKSSKILYFHSNLDDKTSKEDEGNIFSRYEIVENMSD